jgi:hypothetical protein
MARNHLLYKVWKTVDEGLSILEEAAAQENVKVLRTDKGIFIPAGVLLQPTRIPRIRPHDSKGSWQGYKAFAVKKDAEGKPVLGEVLYEGIDPVMAIRFATGKGSNPDDSR